VTTFRGETWLEGYDLPPKISIQDEYKFIEQTSKGFCGDVSADEELSLSSGSCEIHVTTHSGLRKFPERHRLENCEDWAAITTIIQNWEQTRRNPSIVIIRNIEVTKKPTTMADVPPITPVAKSWLFKQLVDQVPKELPEGRGTFIPKDEIERLSTSEIISRVIQDEHGIPVGRRASFAKEVHDKAPKLFLLLVKERVSLSLLYLALKNGITDKSLPLSGDDVQWIPDDTDRIIWSRILPQNQWPFIAAEFLQSMQHQKFGPRIIIPYIWEKILGEGAFSTVYGVQLEPSHQRLYHLDRVSI
jgi:hypothetical protein